MTHETLSALLDGECTDQELDALLNALDREPEMKATWGRMQLARDVRGGTPVRHNVDICAAVMAGLGEAPDGQRPKVVELVARHRPRVSWRAAAGFAAAASVAAVAITLGVNFGSVHGDHPALTAANDAVAVPQQLAGIRNVGFGSAASGQGNGQMDEDLRYYMIEHSNTLADRGVGGALSYARFAANTADEAFAQPVNLTSGGTP